MSEPTIEEAMAEAYATAPVDIVLLHTLEISHPSFEIPVRVARWPVTGPEPETFRCRLEDDAPRDAGQTVEFTAMPFEVKLPEKSQETCGQFEISLDGVGSQLDETIELAVKGMDVCTAVFRTFIKGREDEGPAEVWPDVEIQNPELDASTGKLTVHGVVLNWINRPFGRLYTPQRYPGLVTL